jgi:hypothetical protein
MLVLEFVVVLNLELCFWLKWRHLLFVSWSPQFSVLARKIKVPLNHLTAMKPDRSKPVIECVCVSAVSACWELDTRTFLGEIRT